MDGTKILSNKFLYEMVKSNWKKYYRTAALNDSLYLHYNGFRTIRNLEQFSGLKCLYFEGNGCNSLKGLEQNLQLRSLFIQENVIETIEGLDSLKELRQINLNENVIKKVAGLKNCTALDTLYLKRNRLGMNEGGDIDALKGLLERPTLHCVDLSDNYLTDPAILPEIFEKMPNIRVLYTQGNKFCNKIPAYRKTMIHKLPLLTYLDDRPVFPEDRRRAEAYARGGIEAERAEVKQIKKEKEDSHWKNHEEFQNMVRKAKQDKKEMDEAKE